MDIPGTLCDYEPEFLGYCSLLTEYPLNVTLPPPYKEIQTKKFTYELKFLHQLFSILYKKKKKPQNMNSYMSTNS